VARILFLYHSVYGHTLKICQFMQAELATFGDTSVVRPLAGDVADAREFDAIVIGASIRHGKHNPAVLEFIQQHRSLLDAKPSAFFSVSLVARKPAKNTPETNPYVKAFMGRSPWQPQLVGVFAGELDYQRYTAFDRHVIRFIMRLNKGPTDLSTKVVFTDWDEVGRFAGRLLTLVGAGGLKQA
jgi:menaquinone-dependent protoporphyrinogen oxidase